MTAATEDTFVDLLCRIPNSDRKELLALWTVLSEVGESRAAFTAAANWLLPALNAAELPKSNIDEQMLDSWQPNEPDTLWHLPAHLQNVVLARITANARILIVDKIRGFISQMTAVNSLINMLTFSMPLFRPMAQKVPLDFSAAHSDNSWTSAIV